MPVLHPRLETPAEDRRDGIFVQPEAKGFQDSHIPRLSLHADDQRQKDVPLQLRQAGLLGVSGLLLFNHLRRADTCGALNPLDPLRRWGLLSRGADTEQAGSQPR